VAVEFGHGDAEVPGDGRRADSVPPQGLEDVSTRDARSPDFVLVLSRGKHRHPRRGACFMEFASYLAGEPSSGARMKSP
jgi:hypothetical protein